MSDDQPSDSGYVASLAQQGFSDSASEERGGSWEYLIVALPVFESAKDEQGRSASVSMLNREGRNGWEAVGMTALPDGTVAVLLKRAGQGDQR